ncbi:hypothetical protein GEMRC1_006186 [Eukaryota sp. GEM-RC1]
MLPSFLTSPSDLPYDIAQTNSTWTISRSTVHELLDSSNPDLLRFPLLIDDLDQGVVDCLATILNHYTDHMNSHPSSEFADVQSFMGKLQWIIFYSLKRIDDIISTCEKGTKKPPVSLRNKCTILKENFLKMMTETVDMLKSGGFCNDDGYEEFEMFLKQILANYLSTKSNLQKASTTSLLVSFVLACIETNDNISWIFTVAGSSNANASILGGIVGQLRPLLRSHLFTSLFETCIDSADKLIELANLVSVLALESESYSFVAQTTVQFIDHVVALARTGKRVGVRTACVSAIVNIIKCNYDTELMAIFCTFVNDKDSSVRMIVLNSLVDIYQSVSEKKLSESLYVKLIDLALAFMNRDQGWKRTKLPFPNEAEISHIKKSLSDLASKAQQWRDNLQSRSPSQVDFDALIRQFGLLPLNVQMNYNSIDGCLALIENTEFDSNLLQSDKFDEELLPGQWLSQKFFDDQRSDIQQLLDFRQKLTAELLPLLLNSVSNLIQRVDDQSHQIDSHLLTISKLFVQMNFPVSSLLSLFPSSYFTDSQTRLEVFGYLVFGVQFSSDQNNNYGPMIAHRLWTLCANSNCVALINRHLTNMSAVNSISIDSLNTAAQSLCRRIFSLSNQVLSVCTGDNRMLEDQLVQLMSTTTALRMLAKFPLTLITREVTLQFIKIIAGFLNFDNNTDLNHLNSPSTNVLNGFLQCTSEFVLKTSKEDQQFLVPFFYQFLSKHCLKLVLYFNCGQSIVNSLAKECYPIEKTRRLLYFICNSFDCWLENNECILPTSQMCFFAQFLAAFSGFERGVITKEIESNTNERANDNVTDYMSGNKYSEALLKARNSLLSVIGNPNGLLGRYVAVLKSVLPKASDTSHSTLIHGLTQIMLLDDTQHTELSLILINGVVTCPEAAIPTYLECLSEFICNSSICNLTHQIAKVFAFVVNHSDYETRKTALTVGGRLISNCLIPFQPLLSILCSLIEDDDDYIVARLKQLVRIIWKSSKEESLLSRQLF